MIKPAINLLPWRTLHRTHHLKNLLVILMSWAGILIFGFYISHVLSHDFIQKKMVIDSQIQQQRHLIARYRKQIYQLKKRHTSTHSQKIIYPDVPKLLIRLARIPVRKAILNDLNIKNNTITLHGLSLQQVELDKITSFLKQQSDVSNLQLQHIENSNNQIAFTITFVLKD
ncbi:hypothetical protein A6A19_03990 [Actinobacillus delphinicola]|uniref:Fimbrial assembly family protein n=1 Tax=Actinobacillus delphinicola TaxID=51161 RepID=A0A448TT41_9PAST|nr:hypothetical protein [Actinobacillus delphinicola]MDG6897173.1 hypothetical protein [Actinobacillus delphinicola]VEJ08993.1 Uncharacterised protein [Actinobacillus delphinicola]